MRDHSENRILRENFGQDTDPPDSTCAPDSAFLKLARNQASLNGEMAQSIRGVPMTITLSDDLEELIAEEIKSGAYESADEVIRASLRLLKAHVMKKRQEGSGLTLLTFSDGLQ